MAGRIETYMHSDSLVQNKGGAIVAVDCETDFAARTPEFVGFSKKIAKLVYAYGDWLGVAFYRPDVIAEKEDLEKTLKEKITVRSHTLII